MSYQRISSLAGARPSGFLSVIAGLLIITSPVFSAGLGSGSETCDAIPVDLGGSLRAAGSETGEPFFVEVDVPAAGILSLDVTGSAPTEAQLGFAGPGCGRAKMPFEPTLVERSATHLVLAAAAPGRHVFRVASSDPLRPLGDFRLRTAFSPNGPRRSFAKEEDEEEIEVEPNPLVHDGLGGGRSLASRLDELCRSGEVDDHGDSFPCATLLAPGRAAAGEIGNGWGDDQDVFVVVLAGAPGTELTTLVIEAAGDVSLVGALYDRSGQQLAGNTDSSGFRIARTVRPGTYFVRVSGRDGGSGFFILRAEESAW